MIIKYRDELGIVVELVDEYNISFVSGLCYFNDKIIDMNNVIEIVKGDQNDF